jgi:hypothetical protein
MVVTDEAHRHEDRVLTPLCEQGLAVKELVSASAWANALEERRVGQ